MKILIVTIILIVHREMSFIQCAYSNKSVTRKASSKMSHPHTLFVCVLFCFPFNNFQQLFCSQADCHKTGGLINFASPEKQINDILLLTCMSYLFSFFFKFNFNNFFCL